MNKTAIIKGIKPLNPEFFTKFIKKAFLNMP